MLDVEFLFFALGDFFFESDYPGMEPELENIVNLFSRFKFSFPQGINIPGIENQGLFANGIGTDAQSKTDVSIMKIVGRADAYIVEAAVFAWRFSFSA